MELLGDIFDENVAAEIIESTRNSKQQVQEIKEEAKVESKGLQRQDTIKKTSPKKPQL